MKWRWQVESCGVHKEQWLIKLIRLGSISQLCLLIYTLEYPITNLFVYPNKWCNNGVFSDGPIAVAPLCIYQCLHLSVPVFISACIYQCLYLSVPAFISACIYQCLYLDWLECSRMEYSRRFCPVPDHHQIMLGSWKDISFYGWLLMPMHLLQLQIWFNHCWTWFFSHVKINLWQFVA